MDNDHNHNHDHVNHQATQDQARSELASVFDEMPNEIPLLLFTSKNKNVQFNDGARQVIKTIRTFTSKINLKEFDISHDMAKKYNIEYAPTILFDPEHYNIRWLGAPLGEEGRTFIEALVMIGYKVSHVSGSIAKVLKKIDSNRHIKVFVSPT